VHTINENVEALIVASKEIGIDVNADKTKYMVMSREKIAGRSHNMKIDDRSFEMGLLTNIFRKIRKRVTYLLTYSMVQSPS